MGRHRNRRRRLRSRPLGFRRRNASPPPGAEPNANRHGRRRAGRLFARALSLRTSAEPTLRLSAILTSLGEDAAVIDQGRDSPALPSNNNTGAVAVLRRGRLRKPKPRKPRSNITLGEIVDRTAHAGFGFLAAFLALVAIPFMGLSLPFGLAISFLGLQMILGRNRPWLPARLRRHNLTMASIQWISQKLTRWTAGLEKWIRPRLPVLTGGPFWGLIGLGLIVQGIGLALPLPIPFSNWLFILPILIYAIGMLEKDGLLIAVAHSLTALMLTLGVIFIDLIVRGLDDLYHGVAGWFAGGS